MLKSVNWLRERGSLLAVLFLYIVALNILIVQTMPIHYKADSYSGAALIYYSLGMHIFGNIMILPIAFHILKLSTRSTISSRIFIFTEFLYFIPGALFIVLSKPVPGYFVHFYLFWLLFVTSYELFPTIPSASFLSYIRKKIGPRTRMILVFLLFAFVIAVALLKGGSFSKLFSEIYVNRFAARNRSIHWLPEVIFSSLGYFIPVLVTFFLLKKNYLLTLPLVILQIFLFTVGSERNLLLNLAACVFIGLTRAKQKTVLLGFTLMLFYVVFEDALKIPPVGRSTFMRYSIVPNINGKMYFEYFRNHEPDWLRSVFPRIARVFNIKSPYLPSISMFVGSVFYGGATNANNGLIGGGMGNFGVVSLLFSPFFYSVGFRIIDWLAEKIRNPALQLAVAFTLILPVLDNNQFLATFLRPGFMSFYVFALFFLPDVSVESNGLGGV